MNLAVIESMRHRGIARSLVSSRITDRDLTIRPSRRARSAGLEPGRASASIKDSGFVRQPIRPKYYTNPVEDAVLMELDPIVVESGPASTVCHHEGGHISHCSNHSTRRYDNADGQCDRGAAAPIQHTNSANWKSPTIVSTWN